MLGFSAGPVVTPWAAKPDATDSSVTRAAPAIPLAVLIVPTSLSACLSILSRWLVSVAVQLANVDRVGLHGVGRDLIRVDDGRHYLGGLDLPLTVPHLHA